MKFRPAFCIFWGIIGFCIIPYFSNLLPGGGEAEQEWLDRVMTHIEMRLRICEDPEMKVAFEHALNYNRIGPFGVRVMQLPETYNGFNHPLCPGITIDEEVPHWSLKLGAMVIVHEAMHDLSPYLRHSHIDNQQILRSL